MLRSLELGLNMVGTVNQVRKRGLRFQLMVRTTTTARPAPVTAPVVTRTRVPFRRLRR
jgi:hypothetical protein